MMAQRRMRKAKPRGKAKARKAPPKRAGAAQSARARRAVTKTSLRKRAVPKIQKRVTARKISPRKVTRRKQPSVAPVEKVIVDTVEEPAPGVVVVTEYEATIERKDEGET